MDVERPDAERIHPRVYLRDPALFGRDPEALWHQPANRDELALVIGAYWQHLAICTVRAMYPVRSLEELARRLGTDNLVYLRRRFAGDFRVPINELCTWAIAFDDVSLLPQFESAADLYPPGVEPLG